MIEIIKIGLKRRRHQPSSMDITSLKKYKKPRPQRTGFPWYHLYESPKSDPLKVRQDQKSCDTALLVTGRETRQRLLSVQPCDSEAHSASGEDRFTAATDSLDPVPDTYLLFFNIVRVFVFSIIIGSSLKINELHSKNSEGVQHFPKRLGITGRSKLRRHMGPALHPDRLAQRRIVHQFKRRGSSAFG